MKRRRRQLADLTARDIDLMRERHDQAELDRYLAEQEAREPRHDPDYRDWLDDSDEPA